MNQFTKMSQTSQCYLRERVPWRKLSDDLNEPKYNFNEFIKVNRPNEPTESDLPMPFKTGLLVENTSLLLEKLWYYVTQFS